MTLKIVTRYIAPGDFYVPFWFLEERIQDCRAKWLDFLHPAILWSLQNLELFQCALLNATIKTSTITITPYFERDFIPTFVSYLSHHLPTFMAG